MRRPVPSPAQLRWQREELALFVHFGVNTFTDREWGDGSENPRIFAPTNFDAAQWARVARAAGFGSIVLTAKHHDGFCLWPTALTTHSVKSSPWRDGSGDVVGELARACRAEGLGLGVYLSPWDRHEPRYGDSPRYMDYYVAQLEELLTRYGRVIEVWFDGANGEGPNGKRQVYDWDRMHATVRRFAPDAVMFSDAGPDVRWIGNERGVAGETCWSTIDPAAVPYAGYDAPGVGETLQRGHPHGSVWRPGETDVSIRPGWFWHPAEDDKVRSVDNLMELYFTSVGRNSKLLLNVPPTTAGLLHANDVAALEGFGRRRRDLLASDALRGARVVAGGATARRLLDTNPDTWWGPAAGTARGTVEVVLARPARANVVRLSEPITIGQVVEGFIVEIGAEGAWTTVARGTTVGYARLARFPALRAERVRVTVESSLDAPRLSQLSLFLDDAAG
ncbi:MAG: alpha-L-fucosidase [Cytophagaceae bacterium]|nr:alpha-L-fucosidase [Gemmatimonadaceae bacterium]